MKREVSRATYSVVEAGRRLGIGRNQAYEAVRRGEIPTIRIGHRILVPVAALERMLQTADQDRDAIETGDCRGFTV